MHISEGAGRPGLVRGVGRLRSDQQRFTGAGVIGTGYGIRPGLFAHAFQVRGRVPGHDGGNLVPAVAVQGAGVQGAGVQAAGRLGGSASQAQERGQVAACRIAPGVDPARIHAIAGSVGAEPADRRPGVQQLGREGGNVRQAVVGGGHHEPGVHQLFDGAEAETVHPGPQRGTLTHPPAAPVEVDHGRASVLVRALPGSTGKVEVQQQRDCVLGPGELDPPLDPQYRHR